MDSDFLLFISNVQVLLEDKEKSDLVLRTLCEYAENKVSRETCIFIIFSLIRSNSQLVQQFAEMLEMPPTYVTRWGNIMNEPFINAVVEFQKYPGAMKNFLRVAKSALIGKNTILDAFVDLEYKSASSMPFIILWKLFKPVIGNATFMQILYDGCIDIKRIPLYVSKDLPALAADFDRSRVVNMMVPENEILMRFKRDVSIYERRTGRVQIGSYGLLPTNMVNFKCSGRGMRDYVICNDRWSMSAAEFDCNFSVNPKNQYEERIFDQEDERVSLDVSITRMTSTIKRLLSLRTAIADSESEDAKNIVIDPKTFPYHNLTPLDYLTIEEIYHKENIEDLLEQIKESPVTTLDIVIERITQRLEDYKNYRLNKEQEYYDLNKKNTRKLQEVSVKKQETVRKSADFDPMKALEKGKEYEATFIKSASDFLNDVLIECENGMSETSTPGRVKMALEKFINIFLHERTQEEIDTLLESYEREETIFPFSRDTVPKKYLTPIMYQALIYYISLCQTLKCILEVNVPTDEQKAQGKKAALIAGFTSVDDGMIKPVDIRDAIILLISNYYISQKHNPNVESTITIPQSAFFKSFEEIGSAICSFNQLIGKIMCDSNSLRIIEALQCPDLNDYKATCLKYIAGSLYITAKFERNNADGDMTYKFKAVVPRIVRTRHDVQISTAIPGSPFMSSDFDMLEHQRKVFNYISMNRKDFHTPRMEQNSLVFRFGPEGTEFKSPGTDWILPKPSE